MVDACSTSPPWAIKGNVLDAAKPKTGSPDAPILILPGPVPQHVFISFSMPDEAKNSVATSKLDDGWPESVEEQGLLLLVWRRNFRNDL